MSAVIEFTKNEPAVFNEFRGQLAELKQNNSAVVFDYATPKGNKEARSHIYALRQTKSAVEKARKQAKQDALEYGRLVDQSAKEITDELEGMIEVHDAPLREIEQREADRVAKHNAGIAAIYAYTDSGYATLNSQMLCETIKQLGRLTPDESYEEFTAEAIIKFKSAMQHLNKCRDSAVQREREQAELEQLRREATEREQKEREDRIAREAAEKAKAEAEAKAKADAEAVQRKAEQYRREAEERDMQNRLAVERAEREQAAALQRAIEAERNRIEAQRIADQQEAETKAANKAHRHKINREALDDLIAYGMTEPSAKALIESIVRGEIRNITVNY